MALGKQRFIKQDTKTLTVKTTIDQLNFTKIKNFCSSTDIMKRVKSKPHTESVFAMPLSNKGLVSSTYKELYKSIQKRQAIQ